MKCYVGLTFKLKNAESGEYDDYNLILTSVEDTSVGSSSTVVQHPLLTGDRVMDHIYRDADTVSLRGKFSQSEASIKSNEKVPTLLEVEELFEKAKDQGVLMDMIKYVPRYDREKDTQKMSEMFKIRKNMVLHNISWTEGINTLGFTFSFQEVMLAETIDIDIDYDDNYLPNITEVTEKSFSELLLNSTDTMKVIVSYLREEKFISDSFWNHYFSLSENKAEWITGIAAGVIGGLVVLAGTGVGALAALAGIAVGFVAYTAVKAIHSATLAARFKEKPFDKWSQSEKDRFEVFLKSMKDEIDQLNTAVKLYGLTEDSDQQVVLSFADEYITLIFTKNNVDKSKISCKANNSNETTVKELSNITNLPNNFGDLKTTDCLYSKNDTYLFVSYTGKEASETEKQNLKNYCIVISTIKPEDIKNAIIDIIKTRLFKIW